MKLSAYIDAVLGVLEYAVFVNVPCRHGVSPRRARVEQLRDLLCPPRPEALGRDLCGNGQVDLDLIIPAGNFYGRAILPCFRVISDGVIQGIEHPARFIKVSLK